MLFTLIVYRRSEYSDSEYSDYVEYEKSYFSHLTTDDKYEVIKKWSDMKFDHIKKYGSGHDYTKFIFMINGCSENDSAYWTEEYEKIKNKIAELVENQVNEFKIAHDNKLKEEDRKLKEKWEKERFENYLRLKQIYEKE